MDDLQDITHNIEYIFLKKIIDGLRTNTITISDAKKIAKEFRELEPFTSIDEAKLKMKIFSEKYIFFSQLSEYTNVYHSEKKMEQVIDKMRQYMKNDQIDEALLTAQSHN